jgi:hypothetical protein
VANLERGGGLERARRFLGRILWRAFVARASGGQAHERKGS